MTVLITADIHQTYKSSERYRWGLIPWLAKEARESNVNHVLILGDLTVAKDNHSAHLVNQIVNQIAELAKVVHVIVLKGNHDFIDSDCPFFGFLSEVDGIEFISNPTLINLPIDMGLSSCLFLPAVRDPSEWEIGIQGKMLVELEPDYIFCHATFDGALSENGTQMRGFPLSCLPKARKIWAGDIHVPQKIGPVEYVGAPYHTRFGDQYEPRVVYVDENGRALSLRYPAPYKFVLLVESLDELEQALMKTDPADQIKVRMRVKRSDIPAWPKLRGEIVEMVKKFECELHGCEMLAGNPQSGPETTAQVDRMADPVEMVERYATAEKIEKKSRQIGIALIKSAL